MKWNVWGSLFTFCLCVVVAACSQTQQQPSPETVSQESSVAPESSSPLQGITASTSASQTEAAKAFSTMLTLRAIDLQFAVNLANINLEIHSIENASARNSDDPDLLDKNNRWRLEAADSFRDWRRQAPAAHLGAGNKLYAAWLTYMDGLLACYSRCDAKEVDKGLYGLGWIQARNEFEIATQ